MFILTLLGESKLQITKMCNGSPMDRQTWNVHNEILFSKTENTDFINDIENIPRFVISKEWSWMLSGREK